MSLSWGQTDLGMNDGVMPVMGAASPATATEVLLEGDYFAEAREPSTSLMIIEQSLPASPASMSRWYSCCTCLPISRGVPVSSAALMASPMSLFASSVVKVGAKSLFEAAVGTTPGTGYQVRRAQLSPEEAEAMSPTTLLSRPSRSARTAPSAVDARVIRSIRLLQIFAAWPVVAPPVGMTLEAIGSM